jgi:hypothetical protein
MEDEPMSLKRCAVLVLAVFLLLPPPAFSQDLFVMSVQGKVVLQKKGGDGPALERGHKLPADGSVNIGPGAALQVMGPFGKLARFEGPCVKPVSTLLQALQTERSRTISKAVGNLWEKFKDMWKEEGDLDSSGGTRGDRPIVYVPRISDRLKNPPGTEIVLVAPRGGYVLGDSVTFLWVNGGALTPQKLSILSDKLEMTYETDLTRTSVAVARSRMGRPPGSVYIWAVSTSGCNPDQAWFRWADPAKAREIRDQIGQASALAGGDIATLHILRAQIYEEEECFADAYGEYLAAAMTDRAGASRGLFDQFIMEKLGLSRKVADEVYRLASKER